MYKKLSMTEKLFLIKKYLKFMGYADDDDLDNENRTFKEWFNWAILVVDKEEKREHAINYIVEYLDAKQQIKAVRTCQEGKAVITKILLPKGENNGK